MNGRQTRKNRGQFVIIAALIIATLTLATTISIYEINIHSQSIIYRPVDELLLGTTSDLERALTHSLAKYSTTILNQSLSPNDSQVMKNWTESMLTSFASYGIRLKDPLLPTWDCHWNGTTSYSLAAVTYDIDVDSYGFKGWMGRSFKYVQLQIFPGSITVESGTTSINFTLKESSINEDATVPIPELPHNPDLALFHVGNYIPSQPFVPATDVTLQYYGNGIYRVTFNQLVDPNTLGIRLDLATPVDKIWISANYFDNLCDWSTLHLFSHNYLQPNYLYTPGTSQFYTPTFNLGNPSLDLIAPISSPLITTARTINITVYLSSTPPQAVKILDMELGFMYEGQYYLMGTSEIEVSGKYLKDYSVSIDVGQDPFVGEFGVRTIPQGSIIQLTLTILFSSQSGSGKVYFDGTTPSQIDLY